MNRPRSRRSRAVRDSDGWGEARYESSRHPTRFGRRSKDLLTQNLRAVLAELGRRLAGDPAAAGVYRLQTEFGGGKTPASYSEEGDRDRVAGAYPFHPELVDILTNRWGSLSGFPPYSELSLIALLRAPSRCWKTAIEPAPDRGGSTHGFPRERLLHKELVFQMDASNGEFRQNDAARWDTVAVSPKLVCTDTGTDAFRVTYRPGEQGDAIRRIPKWLRFASRQSRGLVQV